jgi:hypothetical protein
MEGAQTSCMVRVVAEQDSALIEPGIQRVSFVSPVALAIWEIRLWRRGRQVAIRVQDEAHNQRVRGVGVAHVGWRAMERADQRLFSFNLLVRERR